MGHPPPPRIPSTTNDCCCGTPTDGQDRGKFWQVVFTRGTTILILTRHRSQGPESTSRPEAALLVGAGACRVRVARGGRRSSLPVRRHPLKTGRPSPCVPRRLPVRDSPAKPAAACPAVRVFDYLRAGRCTAPADLCRRILRILSKTLRCPSKVSVFWHAAIRLSRVRCRLHRLHTRPSEEAPTGRTRKPAACPSTIQF